MNEELLFTFLREGLYPDLVKSEGIYDTYDCISRQAGHYIELKCRARHYDTLLIEEMKYRKLITQAAERDLVPYYINSTPLGIYSFDLMDLAEPVWYVHYLPATTEFEKIGKVDKLVGYLPISKRQCSYDL
jgi:hypothetical protein